jgi:hypothetical protein
MAWYLAPALTVGRAEVNRRWPKRDLTSDGTVGDEAHQATRSDHNPNARESVNASTSGRSSLRSNSTRRRTTGSMTGR